MVSNSSRDDGDNGSSCGGDDKDDSYDAGGDDIVHDNNSDDDSDGNSYDDGSDDVDSDNGDGSKYHHPAFEDLGQAHDSEGYTLENEKESIISILEELSNSERQERTTTLSEEGTYKIKDDQLIITIDNQDQVFTKVE